MLSSMVATFDGEHDPPVHRQDVLDGHNCLITGPAGTGAIMPELVAPCGTRPTLHAVYWSE